VPASEIVRDAAASRTVVTDPLRRSSTRRSADPQASEPPSDYAGAQDRALEWTATDWKLAGLLAGVPAAILTFAAVIGYPLITGDNLVQNYPLEVLTGQVIRHGHLPLYDSFAWSGTPLLGGTNAHSLLPITLLFAVLPSLAAWVIGEAFVLAAAGVGCQLFLRRTRCGSLASALGGASFGLGGFVSAQIVHIDFVAAAAALPWVLVALHGLATRPAPSRPRHCLLLAVAVAWICLTGSPDIVIDTVVGCSGYLVHLLLQPLGEGRRSIARVRLCAWVAGGGLTGLALGALQWAPAASFVSVSERANPSFAYISGGSLGFGNFLELLVPHVFGGALLGSRKFGGSFPISEINGYPGTLLLAGLFVMLVSWRRADAWRWRVWLVLCVAALVIALGSHTPVEHLLAALPIVGKQRLPNRALVLFSLSVSLLGAYFLDWLFAHHPSRRQVTAGLIPLVGVFGVVLATLVTGKPAGGALVPKPGNGWTLGGVLPDLAVSAVLAAAVGWFLVSGWRLVGRRRAVVIILLVLVDLASADVNQSSYAPVSASALTPADHAKVAALVGDGRYLVVDPLLFNEPGLFKVGEPDLGAVDTLLDAGGYSSLTWGPYATATGTHVQNALTASAITEGTLSTLDVTTIFAFASQVITRPADYAAAPFELTADSRLVRWFGADITVSSVTLDSPSAPAAALRRLGASVTLLGADGALTPARFAISPSPGEVTVHYATPVKAMGLRLGGPAVTVSVAIDEPTVLPYSKKPFVTAGPLASALGSAGWVELNDVGGLSTFVNPNAGSPYSTTAPGAVVALLSSNVWTGGASVQVTTQRSTWLVRSVADVPGWRATLTQGGRVSNVPVEKDGLIQRVAVPPGTSTVTFFYVAPGWREGQILALGGALGFAALMVAVVVGGRRRRPRGKKQGLSEAGGSSLAPL